MIVVVLVLLQLQWSQSAGPTKHTRYLGGCPCAARGCRGGLYVCIQFYILQCILDVMKKLLPLLPSVCKCNFTRRKITFKIKLIKTAHLRFF